MLVWICWCSCADLCYQSALSEGTVCNRKIMGCFQHSLQNCSFFWNKHIWARTPGHWYVRHKDSQYQQMFVGDQSVSVHVEERRMHAEAQACILSRVQHVCSDKIGCRMCQKYSSAPESLWPFQFVLVSVKLFLLLPAAEGYGHCVVIESQNC